MNGNFKHNGIILISGNDSPGVTQKLFETLEPFNIEIQDFEQVIIRGRLILSIQIGFDPAHEKALEADLVSAFEGSAFDIAMDFENSKLHSYSEDLISVDLIGEVIKPSHIAQIAAVISNFNGNIESVRKLAQDPLRVFEFALRISNPKENLDLFKNSILSSLTGSNIDVAVQLVGKTRLSKRLVMLDMDSTLIQQEVIDLLAAQAGVGDKVSAITERAMRGEIDFVHSLKERVSLLSGLDSSIVGKVANEISLTPGAENLLKTLQTLGHKVGVVSGGFLDVIEPLLKNLKIDYYRANKLEIIDGRLTGKVLGEIVDRKAKALYLEEFAKSESIALSQCVAIGDGANDLDMLQIAGLGIAFNAKPKVAKSADVAINTPYLDSILYLLGISPA